MKQFLTFKEAFSPDRKFGYLDLAFAAIGGAAMALLILGLAS
jgi:hypothetical protein